MLQEGGFEKHEFITAGDKDLDPVWDKICDFATKDVFDFALREGMISEAIYTPEEVESLLVRDRLDELKEIWLEPIYGVASKMQS